MKKQNHFTAGIIFALCFLILYNFSSFAFECNNIRNDTVRLHIIANSDSEKDQTIKLKIRDEILKRCPDIFNGEINTENIKAKITPNLSLIENEINTILKVEGYAYTGKADLVYEYFDTRCYNGSITLPAGKYTALKITLGNGEGKNWWCVMFPALCLPAATENAEENAKETYSEAGKNIVFSKNKYEIRFKILEYIEEMKNNLTKG